MRVLMQREVKNICEPDIRPASYGNIRQYFAESLRDGSYIGAVADLDGTLVSSAGLVFFRKPPSLMGGKGIIGYVTNVYTAPEWRRRGIAGELMKILIEQGRLTGADKLYLGSTEAGKSVYESVGFEGINYAALELKLSA